MRKATVLLVDDVADLRFLLRVMFETDGTFEVVGEAGDGRRAVTIAERDKPDIIVLDLSMPTMDGLEALPRLRQLLPDATIVVLSGFEGKRVAASASALGADAYFEKGTPPSAVVDAVKHLLGVEPVEPAPAAPADASILADAELHAMVAHDLRSPLSAIIGFGDTLERRWDDVDDATRRGLVHHMTTQARVLQALTDNLLAAQSIDMNAIDVDLRPTAPAALLTDLSAMLESVSGEHPLDLRVAPDLPVVLVDRMRVMQILVNLVTNADRHAPPGTPIGVSARSDGAWVAVEVSDAGPGIPYADRIRVLEKHVRLSGDGRGLGLGLFVASRMARAMGGSLAITDSDSGGARVVCRLQVADVSS